MDRTRWHTAAGSTTVNPTATTAYEFAAVSGSARRVLTTGVALGGRVVEYRRQPGLVGFTATAPFSPTATAARSIADRIASRVRDQQKRNLLGKALEVHVIPDAIELTALPPWSYLRDKTTCTGLDNQLIAGCVSDRSWNDVRGAGGTAVGTDRIAVAAGAETLVNMPSQWPFSGLPVFGTSVPIAAAEPTPSSWPVRGLRA